METKKYTHTRTHGQTAGRWLAITYSGLLLLLLLLILPPFGTGTPWPTNDLLFISVRAVMNARNSLLLLAVRPL